ncbi:MAG: hypothetical protein ACOY7P_18885 [Pseudomonadota bacterium]
MAHAFEDEFGVSPGVLACIAYAAARVALGPCASQVFDHARNALARVGGTVSGGRVGLYDYDRGCNFSGTLPELWDDGERVRIVLHVGDDGAVDAVIGGHALTGWIDRPTVFLKSNATGAVRRYSVTPWSDPRPDRSP